MRYRLFLAALFLVTGPASGVASDSFFFTDAHFAGSYICEATAAGGVRYDHQSRQWHGTAFKADDRFVVTLKAEGPGMAETEVQPSAMGFSVSVNELGKPNDRGQNICLSTLEKTSILPIFSNGQFSCDDITARYDLNVLTLTYMKTFSLTEFAEVLTDNTPYIEVGTCAKID